MTENKPSAASKTYNYLEAIEVELQALKLIESKLLEEKKKIIFSHNQVTLQKQKINKGKLTDSRGEVIEIGDEVRFNTKGGYHSKEGRVIRFTKNFIIARDSNHNEIRRHPKNVTVLSKKVIT